MAAPITAEAPGATLGAQLRDLVALTKVRINLLNLWMMAGGMWLAPGTTPPTVIVTALVGTALVIAGSGTLNCYLERDVDALMKRTRNRPLPTGRIAPQTALTMGLVLSFLGIPLLTFGVNPLTGLLGAVALVSYVLVYTPMKRKTPHALILGAFPGAMPPLMGWTAATNSLDAPGIILFSVLFLWQLPHFLALSLYLKDDYALAGIRVAPLVQGEEKTRFDIVRYTFATVAVSMLLYPFKLAGVFYLVTAAVLGVVFLGWAFWGLRANPGPRWSRSMFLVSIAYLTILFTVLMIDRHGA